MNVHISSMPAQGVFINNRWRPASSGRTLEVRAPSDGQVFAHIAAGASEDVDAAVGAARSAVEGSWGKLTAAQRGRLACRDQRQRNSVRGGVDGA